MQVNREKLADVLAVATRTIDEYKRVGMPGKAPEVAGGQWSYDTGTVIKWLRARERSEALGKNEKIDEHEGKRRKIAAEAAIAEFELAKKQGTVLLIADFNSAWERMIGACRAKLLGLGAGLGPVVALSEDPVECRSIIHEAVEEALQELSDFQPQIQIEPGGGSEPPGGLGEAVQAVGAASETDSQ